MKVRRRAEAVASDNGVLHYVQMRCRQEATYEPPQTQHFGGTSSRIRWRSYSLSKDFSGLVRRSAKSGDTADRSRDAGSDPGGSRQIGGSVGLPDVHGASPPRRSGICGSLTGGVRDHGLSEAAAAPPAATH